MLGGLALGVVFGEIGDRREDDRERQPAEDGDYITADNKTMNYGDDVPSLTYKSSGATLEGIPKLSTTATSSSPVGTYPIKVEQGTVSNGNVIYVNGTLTIEPAAGIESVYADGLGNAVIYNVNGQKLLKPQKGINIIGGKKVVLK